MDVYQRAMVLIRLGRVIDSMLADSQMNKQDREQNMALRQKTDALNRVTHCVFHHRTVDLSPQSGCVHVYLAVALFGIAYNHKEL